MPFFEHDTKKENAIRFSRFDESSPFSTVSQHSFQLEDRIWPTVEHYYQAHKFEGLATESAVLSAASGKHAYKLGNRWFQRKVKGWKEKRRVWMTRGIYRKVMEYDEIKTALLDTQDELIIETSMYDHFWGLGRDQRGENMLGKIWMDVRSKVQEKN